MTETQRTPSLGNPDRCDWVEAGQPYPNECGRLLPCDRHSTDSEGHPFGFVYHDHRIEGVSPFCPECGATR